MTRICSRRERQGQGSLALAGKTSHVHFYTVHVKTTEYHIKAYQ